MPPATSRTTPAKRKKRPSSFEAKRQALIEGREGSSVFEWEVYDRVWHLKRPNLVLMGQLEDSDSLNSVSLVITAHLIQPERKEFLEALAADEDLDIEIIGAMLEDMTEIVYAEIPTPPPAD